jgi:hypothetical protein
MFCQPIDRICSTPEQPSCCACSQWSGARSPHGRLSPAIWRLRRQPNGMSWLAVADRARRSPAHLGGRHSHHRIGMVVDGSDVVGRHFYVPVAALHTAWAKTPSGGLGPRKRAAWVTFNKRGPLPMHRLRPDRGAAEVAATQSISVRVSGHVCTCSGFRVFPRTRENLCRRPQRRRCGPISWPGWRRRDPLVLATR